MGANRVCGDHQVVTLVDHISFIAAKVSDGKGRAGFAISC